MSANNLIDDLMRNEYLRSTGNLIPYQLYLAPNKYEGDERDDILTETIADESSEPLYLFNSMTKKIRATQASIITPEILERGLQYFGSADADSISTAGQAAFITLTDEVDMTHLLNSTNKYISMSRLGVKWIGREGKRGPKMETIILDDIIIQYKKSSKTDQECGLQTVLQIVEAKEEGYGTKWANVGIPKDTVDAICESVYVVHNVAINKSLLPRSENGYYWFKTELMSDGLNLNWKYHDKLIVHPLASFMDKVKENVRGIAVCTFGLVRTCSFNDSGKDVPYTLDLHLSEFYVRETTDVGPVPPGVPSVTLVYESVPSITCPSILRMLYKEAK